MEYNKLTQKLLAEGYTAEHYPNYVKIPSGSWGKNLLENIYGGFEYQRYYTDDLIYKTGCGMFVKGINVLDNLGYRGIEWCHENDNPVIRCPYDKTTCEKNNPLLHGMHGGGICIMCWCECHRTDEPYNYENSFEKAEKERQEEREQKYKEFSDKHNGRVCRNHMFFDERTKEWHLNYKPNRCANVCYTPYFCPIRNRPLDKKKGNVYYDMKKSYIRNDGSLFDGQEIVSITKGIRFFEHPVSMDICRDFIKIQSDEIATKYEVNYACRERMADKSFKFEVINIRAESKPSRDLMQDLEDIAAGIEIVHQSDVIKQKKEDKKQHLQELQQKKIKRLEKKILENGYDSLESYGADKAHADKWLGCERIAQLEAERRERLKQEQQISLFDYLTL